MADMKKKLVILALALAMPAFAQQASKPASAAPPQLSTADKVAIQICEKTKQEAQKQFMDAEQQELTILREFGAAHPGFHVNQQSFAVEADPPQPVVKQALPTKK